MGIKDYDVVTHPSHYCEGKSIEPIKVIQDWQLDFCLGSALKYIARAGKKDDIIQDLRKAIKYIEFEIEAIQEERKENDFASNEKYTFAEMLGEEKEGYQE